MEQLEQKGKTAMFASIDGEYAGMVAVSDTVKETSKRAIQRLKDMGIEVIMLTGDNERTAKAIGEEVGINQVIAEVLPEQKGGRNQEIAEGRKESGNGRRWNQRCACIGRCRYRNGDRHRYGCGHGGGGYYVNARRFKQHCRRDFDEP